MECLDLVSVHTAKGVLWHAVEIRSRTKVDRLSGLGRSAADELAADLVAFVNEHLGSLIRSVPRLISCARSTRDSARS